MVEVQRLERVMGANAVAGGLGGEFGTLGGFRGSKPPGLIGAGNQLVVGGAGNDEEFGHGCGWLAAGNHAPSQRKCESAVEDRVPT